MANSRICYQRNKLTSPMERQSQSTIIYVKIGFNVDFVKHYVNYIDIFLVILQFPNCDGRLIGLFREPEQDSDF